MWHVMKREYNLQSGGKWLVSSQQTVSEMEGGLMSPVVSEGTRIPHIGQLYYAWPHFRGEWLAPSPIALCIRGMRVFDPVSGAPLKDGKRLG